MEYQPGSYTGGRGYFDFAENWGICTTHFLLLTIRRNIKSRYFVIFTKGSRKKSFFLLNVSVMKERGGGKGCAIKE